MFENLIKIVVSYTELGINNLLIIDNINNTISFNEKCIKFNSNDFSDFLNTFLRIIREWENKDIDKNFNNNFVLNIRFFENKKEYNLCINNIPDNFDSFLNLVNKINS